MELVPIAVFLVVMLTVLFVAQFMLNRSVTRRRLEALSTQEVVSPVERGSTDQPSPVTLHLSNRRFEEKMMLEMTRAGLRTRPSEFALIMFVSVILLAVIGFMINRSILAAMVMGAIGYVIPIVYLKAKQARRLSGFNDQISDALSLMGSSLRSGYSFIRAMQVVSNEMPAPISEEFVRVNDECNVGVPIEDALAHLVERMRSYDLELVVTAVTIQIHLGGNLAEILDTIAETIRERVRINGEVSALTAEGKLSAIILIALPFFLFAAIYVLNPGYLQPLWEEQVGQYLVAAALALTVLGSFVMRKMLEIDF